jgi:hypothetical protein
VNSHPCPSSRATVSCSSLRNAAVLHDWLPISQHKETDQGDCNGSAEFRNLEPIDEAQLPNDSSPLDSSSVSPDSESSSMDSDEDYPKCSPSAGNPTGQQAGVTSVTVASTLGPFAASTPFTNLPAFSSVGQAPHLNSFYPAAHMCTPAGFPVSFQPNSLQSYLPFAGAPMSKGSVMFLNEFPAPVGAGGYGYSL